MTSGPAAPAPARDPFDARLDLRASGMLRELNAAGVLHAADVQVARRLGRLAGERDETVLLAVALAVRAPRLGHVCVDLERIADTVAVDVEEPVDLEGLRWPEPAEWVRGVAASALVDTGGADPRPLRLEGTTLYLDRYFSEEVDVAAALRSMAADEPPVDGELLAQGVARLFGNEASEPQAIAAATAVRSRFAVVAGGPGTGKTTTVARIVALLCEQAVGSGAPPPLIALAAPTGRAAARLQETVHAAAATLSVTSEIRDRLAGLRASTIHRLLGSRPDSDSRFRHDRGRPLPHDVVIVDETSMVSLSLMARLVDALRPGTRLILVGDPAQLVSIEAGAVLGDIVGPGAPTSPRPGIAILDRVHRFGAAIAELAQAIRAGDGDGTIEILRGDHDDVSWVRDDDATGPVARRPPGAVLAPALEAARETVNEAQAGHAGAALAALGGFRVLCAHRRGPRGVGGWTALMEDALAAEIPGLDPDDRWFVGRPLLVTENDPELSLSNGDAGVVIATGDGGVACAFTRGNETVVHSPSRLGAVQTSYAITIHRSQGSQYDAVAVVLPEPGSRLLTRELLYTAVTRARRRLILVGAEQAIRAAVARPAARASGLGRRLWGG